MSLPRILATNRRERHRTGPDLSGCLLYAFSALLSLVRFFPKGREKPEGSERLSTQKEREFRAWCREQASAPGTWTVF